MMKCKERLPRKTSECCPTGEERNDIAIHESKKHQWIDKNGEENKILCTQIFVKFEIIYLGKFAWLKDCYKTDRVSLLWFKIGKVISKILSQEI